MGEYNDALDDIRMGVYRLLELEAENFSEKKSLAKREVQFMINDLRIKIENL